MFHLFHLEPESGRSLQQQIRSQLTAAILNGNIPADMPLPSTRKLSQLLRVSRNTVIRVYEQMLADGVILSRERSGYFVNPDFRPQAVPEPVPVEPTEQVNWERFLHQRPSEQRNIVKQQHWQRYQYPFVYGQFDPQSFPIQQWRECCRDSVTEAAVGNWAADQLLDDPMLIEHIQTHILPRRGIWARPEQILITCGAQHAVYLVTQLVLKPGDRFAIEDPNYVDVRNIAASRPAELVPIPLDDEGMRVDQRLASCDCVYVTPSHQFPTTVTMSLARRKQLLAAAAEHDFLIIEDDYEAEANFTATPCPALKSIDHGGRVIYVGSFSKTLAPGLRLGYMVADETLIREVHALRRLMMRHAPMNNQRTVALFISRGYYDQLINKQALVYKERWRLMAEALHQHLPDSSNPPSFGGSSYWVEGPASLDSRQLAEQARQQGILIEPGEVYYSTNPPQNCFKLGYSSIPAERIEPGIRRLAELIHSPVGN
ncbi:PLP-dependent aminotransferase family protein [Marinobacterium sp. CAU 1594]|nr:PLP-dependent aminotransferase family protein [Marinobacterium arenosum]